MEDLTQRHQGREEIYKELKKTSSEKLTDVTNSGRQAMIALAPVLGTIGAAGLAGTILVNTSLQAQIYVVHGSLFLIILSGLCFIDVLSRYYLESMQIHNFRNNVLGGTHERLLNDYDRLMRGEIALNAFTKEEVEFNEEIQVKAPKLLARNIRGEITMDHSEISL